jgi:hypothetical protein
VDESDFEGTLVLERLAEIGELDAFWEAVDSDDAASASRLLKHAKIDSKVIQVVLQKMAAADGEH